LWFNDESIFGTTNGGLKCFVSVLNGKKVVYPVMPQFNVDTFPPFVQCYILLCLCKVADYVSDEVEKAFKE